jgi:hypothetical protein
MNRQIIKKSAAIVSVAVILFLTGLSFYFGMTGNDEAFFLVISFNAFLVIMLYFLIRIHRSNQIKSTLSKMEDQGGTGDTHEQ